MNLIVSVAIILLNLYVAYGHKFVYDEVSKAFTFTAQCLMGLYISQVSTQFRAFPFKRALSNRLYE